MFDVSKEDYNLLLQINEETKTEQGYGYYSNIEFLIFNKLVDVNKLIGDPEKGYATRISEKGKQVLVDFKDRFVKVEEQIISKTVNGFEIDSNVPIPKAKRVRRSVKYPFDVLDVGQSFHVPKTEDNVSPEKRLSTSVSTRNKKDDKSFCVRKVNNDDIRGEGARVFRTA